MHRSYLLGALALVVVASSASAQLADIVNNIGNTVGDNAAANATNATLNNTLNATAPIVAAIPTLNASTNATPAAANATNNGTLAAASTPPTVGQCATTCVRMEWRSMSGGQRSAYLQAVRTLQTNGKYDQLVRMHVEAEQFAHGTPYFLPWHRAYLREYERALQEVAPGTCLPFWNWALDSQAPENAMVFSRDAFGGNGGAGGCVQDGAFAQWRPSVPQSHCLQRQWNGGDVIGAYPSVEAVNRVITSSSDYATFRTRCESVLHPAVHNNMGGDMSRMYSPNDPLFWSHHAYVDYMWVQWQRRHGLDFSGGNRGATAQGLPYTVDQVMDHRGLCYEYRDLADSDLSDDNLPPPQVERPPQGQRPPMVDVRDIPNDEGARFSPRDRSNLGNLRFPDSPSDEWCSMMHLDVAEVRRYEEEYRTVYRQLNSIKGYLSPCCLMKRPSLCRGLVGKVQKFCIDVVGYGRMEIGYDSPDPYAALSNVRRKAEYCTPDVELPPEAYRSEIEKLVGASAFDGAGSLKRITGMDGIASAGSVRAWMAAATAGVLAAVAMPAL